MSEQKVYEKLIARLRTWLFDLPDSELLMPLLKLRFSYKEAEFLSRFPFIPSTLNEVAELMDVPQEQLSHEMQPMIKKGLICLFEGKTGTRYAFTDHLFFLYRMPGWKGEHDEWNRKILSLANQYYVNHFGADFVGHPTKGLRAIPLAHTIRDTRRILPYEDVLEYVEREEYHSVSTCACRHRHNIDPNVDSCRHDTQNCLHFGKLGSYTVQQGMGRRISREETQDILQKAADAGLVHGISNSKKGMDTVCNCCSCCCLFLEPVKMPALVRGKHQRSNYLVRHDAQTCKACGLCEKRCPVNAIELRNKEGSQRHEGSRKPKEKDLKFVAYDPDQCIGCGVCVHKCPTQSLSLVRREQEEDVPETLSELGRRFLLERGRDMSKIF
jgi:NAD-dependent dihydropyrimidine dehydrogenase PreA subunit